MRQWNRCWCQTAPTTPRCSDTYKNLDNPCTYQHTPTHTRRTWLYKGIKKWQKAGASAPVAVGDGQGAGTGASLVSNGWAPVVACHGRISQSTRSATVVAFQSLPVGWWMSEFEWYKLVPIGSKGCNRGPSWWSVGSSELTLEAQQALVFFFCQREDQSRSGRTPSEFLFWSNQPRLG